MKRQKIIIEVGTFDAEDTLKYYKLYPDVEKIYTFEPHPLFFHLSSKKCRSIPKIEIINKAVFNRDQKDITFNECNEGGASSILNFEDKEEELIRNWCPCRTDIHSSERTFTVDSTRLDTFLNERGHSPLSVEIVYIHIDAQGVDLECFESLGDDYMKTVKSGCLETVKEVQKETVKEVQKGIYKEQSHNSLQNIEKVLFQNGFKIDRVSSNDPTNCEYNVFFSSC